MKMMCPGQEWLLLLTLRIISLILTISCVLLRGISCTALGCSGGTVCKHKVRQKINVLMKNGHTCSITLELPLLKQNLGV